MKTLVILLSLLSLSVSAQQVNIKDAAAGDEDTTIQIKKGKASPNEIRYEVVSGEDAIAGEAAPLLKDARENWKKACADWKKETKENNKDVQVVSLSCGTMECATVSMESTCTSKAQRKMRVRMTE